MKTKNIGSFLLITGAACLAGNAAAQSGSDWDASFKKRIYIGAGIGATELEPRTDGTPFFVQDESDTGALLVLGLDFSRRLSVELQYADLGDSQLVDTTAAESLIGYTEASLSGLFYLWNGLADDEYLDFDGLDTRSGLSLFGRFGVGQMDNDSIGNVTFRRDNDVQVLVGLGLEYGLPIGLAARAEYIRYDSDAAFAGLSLLYRFGGRDIGPVDEPVLPVLLPPAPISELPPPPIPAELPTLPELQGLPELPSLQGAASEESTFDATDGDADGVTNSVDDCPDTASGTPVNDNGCEMFNGVIEGVNFLSGSDTLTDTARVALDEVVGTLSAFPEVQLAIEAHTDSRGDDQANFDLSRLRALSVVRYLIAQGIDIGRLQARAFGEVRPIADNATEDGRLLNRRVEFRTQP